MGPIAWAMTSRCRLRRGPEASMSQTPPPKSAPPKSTYALSDSARMAASASASWSSDTAHDGRCVNPGPVAGLGTAKDLAIEEPSHNHSQKAVQQREQQKRHHQAGHWSNRVGGAKHALDYPGLPSYFGDRPARFDGNESHGRCHSDRAEEPAAAGHTLAPDPGPCDPE